jgi:hypothetical protein
MSFKKTLLQIILPVSAFIWAFWLGLYGFNATEMPFWEIASAFFIAFTSVVLHIALVIGAFDRENAVFMALVLGSTPLRLLLVFAEVALILGDAKINQGVFVSGLLLFYLTYLYIEIYLVVKNAHKLATKRL